MIVKPNKHAAIEEGINGKAFIRSRIMRVLRNCEYTNSPNVIRDRLTQSMKQIMAKYRFDFPKRLRGEHSNFVFDYVNVEVRKSGQVVVRLEVDVPFPDTGSDRLALQFNHLLTLGVPPSLVFVFDKVEVFDRTFYLSRNRAEKLKRVSERSYG